MVQGEGKCCPGEGVILLHRDSDQGQLGDAWSVPGGCASRPQTWERAAIQGCPQSHTKHTFKRPQWHFLWPGSPGFLSKHF